MSDKPLTSGEIAALCHVTHRAVLKWIASGKLKAYRTPGKHTRIETEDFVSFLETYNMPIPEAIKDSMDRKKRIMIIDDDPLIVKTLQKILDKSNLYDTMVAFNGFSAGLIFKEFRPDLITLDINMPMVDGYEVCSFIREDIKDDQTSILVISSDDDDLTQKKMLKAGANDFMAKPVSSSALTSKVEELLTSKK